MFSSSVRLSFEKDGTGKFIPVQSTPSLAMSYPSADTGERMGVTGFWLQLENSRQEILYRMDISRLLEAEFLNKGGEEIKGFDVLVPVFFDAEIVALYGPPSPGGNDFSVKVLGKESVLLGCFPFPKIIQFQQKVAPELPADICGKGLGQVLQIENKIYHGRVHNIYNLVLLGDGFEKTEQDAFEDKANECINFLMAHSPCNSAFGITALNVFFVKVASNSKENPYFGSQFYRGITRITWTRDDVKKVCDTLFFDENRGPYWHWAGLIVNNNSQRAGTTVESLSQFAVGTYDDNEKDRHFKVFQHELGHAVFHLADEYDTPNEFYEGLEPNYPNVTKEHTLETLKWKEFVTPGVPIPTPKPGKDSVVGCYEGGHTFKHGIYRPQQNCVMHDQTAVDGSFCVACENHGANILAHGIRFVPVPGSLLYSDADRTWRNRIVSMHSQVVNDYGSWTGYQGYFGVVDELKRKDAGNNICTLFQEKARKILSGQITVFELYYDNTISEEEEGLWYLTVSDNEGEKCIYFIHCWKVFDHVEIGLGEMKLPAFPQMTLFDGVMVGQEMHVFCGDSGKLSYGKQDAYGNIEPFKIQEVSGLETGSALSQLSVDFEHSRIMVTVIDALRVKIAAYELTQNKWNSSGFIVLPGDIDFDCTRISQSGNFVHVAARTQNGIYYRVFNTVNMAWESDSALAASPASYFDICADGVNVYLLINAGPKVFLYTYNTLIRQWSEPSDVTASMGLLSGEIVTSFSIAILNKHMHVVALINQQPKHAIYNTINNEWISKFIEITPLVSMHETLAAMMFHSSSTQLYLTLSAMIPAPVNIPDD
ncbi:MAG: M64 family metallopeptidase [Treponema sp.]|jgi:hypothetical protein|nr:M64 family metallopeptidase [Treponema sp.]